MLFESLVTPEIAFVAAAIIMFMLALGRITFRSGIRLNQSYAWQNFGWLATITLGVLAAFMPGVCPVIDQGWGAQSLWGVIAGGTAMLGHKALKPIIRQKFEGK